MRVEGARIGACHHVPSASRAHLAQHLVVAAHLMRGSHKGAWSALGQHPGLRRLSLALWPWSWLSLWPTRSAPRVAATPGTAIKDLATTTTMTMATMPGTAIRVVACFRHIV